MAIGKPGSISGLLNALMESTITTHKPLDELQLPITSQKPEQLPQPKLPVSKVLLYSSYSIIIHLCEVDGKIPFSNAACVLVIEIFKLFLSLGMFIAEVIQEQWSMVTPKNFNSCLRNRLKREFLTEGEESDVTSKRQLLWLLVPFAVPAILYTITNNLGLMIQMEMDPATYQVLANLKVFSTAILFRIIIKRPLSYRQWFALFLLIVAGVINGSANYDTSNTNSSSMLHITFKGIIMMSIYCTVSGFASVYTEYVLKSRVHMSLNIQNATLYIFGTIINASLYVFQEAIVTGNFYLIRGFTFLTWLLVVTQGISGIFIGFVMKYASSILRLFIISAAMIVTTVFSVFIFDLVLKTSFIISAALVICALVLYHL
nr:UDP sugar transporter protein SLC35A4 [Hymenolepis microstoma]